MTVVVTVAALSVHLHFRPYAAAKLQVLETMSLSVSLLTFVLAQLLLASGNRGGDNPTAELIVAVAILAANALFVGMFCVLLRDEMARKVRLCSLARAQRLATLTAASYRCCLGAGTVGRTQGTCKAWHLALARAGWDAGASRQREAG